MIDLQRRRLECLLHDLLCLFCPASPRRQSGSRRKRREKSLQRCFFMLLLLHICGCETVLDSPIVGSDDQSINSITSLDLLHPLNATFTLAFESHPAFLKSISVRASGEIGFLPDRILESVYLIYPSESNHGVLASQPPLAAAFILRIYDLNSSGQPTLFLVTARHVVDPRWARCAGQNPTSIELRLNREIGGVGYQMISLQNGSTPTFITSSDTTVDLALIPIKTGAIADLGDYKILEISYDDLLTFSDLPLLHQSLPISTTGMSPPTAESQVRYPTRITGSILQMRDEETELPCGTHDLDLQQTKEPQDQSRHNLHHVCSSTLMYLQVLPAPRSFLILITDLA